MGSTPGPGIIWITPKSGSCARSLDEVGRLIGGCPEDHYAERIMPEQRPPLACLVFPGRMGQAPVTPADRRAPVPLCFAEGRTTAAAVCAHVTPHRGDPELFWSA